jgi:antitoxin HicB
MAVSGFGVRCRVDYIVARIFEGAVPMAKQRTYTIQLRPEPEGGFTVRVPALPEIVTYGIDEEEAHVMAREAIELALEVRREDGDEIPADITPLMRTISIAA